MSGSSGGAAAASVGRLRVRRLPVGGQVGPAVLAEPVAGTHRGAARAALPAHDPLHGAHRIVQRRTAFAASTSATRSARSSDIDARDR